MTVCMLAALALAAGVMPAWEMHLEVDDAAGRPVVRKVASAGSSATETVEPDGVRRFVWPTVVDETGARQGVRVEITVREIPGGRETEGLVCNQGEGLRVTAFDGPSYGPVPAVSGRDVLHVPFEHGARAARCNRTTDEFSEMICYTFPGTLFMDRNWDCSLLLPTEINSALITGHPIDFEIRYIPDRAYAQHGRLPALDAYKGMVMEHDPVRMRAVPVERRFDALKAAMDFRRANRDVLLRGTFRDTDGFAIDAHPSLLAKGWLSDDGRTLGILVYNRDGAAHPCTLTVPDGAFLEASAPGCGAVNPQSSLPAESVRLYCYALTGALPADGAYRP